MRALALCALAAALGGCAPAQTTAKHDYDARFGEIRAAIIRLPASEERTELSRLVSALEGEISSDSSLAERAALEREAEQLRQLVDAAAVDSLELGFATAFKDWTGDGEYDGIEVHITPRDSTGSALKRPGSAEVVLQTSGFFGSVKELQRWEVSAGLLAESWNESLFPAYILRLSWKNDPPDVRSAIVHVDFRPVAGKAVSASFQIEKSGL
ncbi:MAG: hypothetical protein ACYTAN_14095 [Planctomycetota bacterium]|jgi:hypothetical protein